MGGTWVCLSAGSRNIIHCKFIGKNGCMYCIPQTASGVLKFNPKTETAEILGDFGEGGWKWHGGIVYKDYIYGVPNNADHVLKIDPSSDTISLLDKNEPLVSGRHRIPQDGRYKYLGGGVGKDGKVYFFPCDAERVACLNPETNEVKLIGPELLQGENKFQNG
eukprot:m.53459 g.53459  ORF g.53459 m.53459 type:complete len:163 (+) comp10867_c0_seq2:651-1139(+)